MGALRFANASAASQLGPKKKAAANWQQKSKEGGPDLPRERISTEAITGEVVEWKGKHGWIQPDEAIDHPMASNHHSHIYCHQKDVLEEVPLEAGHQVYFHVYADSTGLG